MRERSNIGRLPKVPSGDTRIAYLYGGALAGFIQCVGGGGAGGRLLACTCEKASGGNWSTLCAQTHRVLHVI